MAWQRLFSNLMSLGAMRVASAGASFALVVMIGREQGPALLGEFSALQSIFVFLQLMPLLGLHVVVIREVAAAPERSAEVVTSATGLAILVSLVLGIGVAISGTMKPGTSPDFSVAAMLVGIAMLPTAWICVAESFLIGSESMKALARWNVYENLARTVISIALLLAGFGLVALYLVFLLCRLWLAWAYWTQQGVGHWVQAQALTREEFGRLLRELPVFVGIMVCAASLNRLDFLLLYAWSAMETVGLYSAAYRFYELAMMVPTLLLVALFPSLAAAFAQGREQFSGLLFGAVRLALLALTPCAVLGATFSPVLIAMFGKRYDQAALILVWLVVSLPAVGLNQCLAAAMLAMKRQKADLCVVAVTALLYAMLLWWWIGRAGALGAAWATTATALLQPGLRLLILRRELFGAQMLNELRIVLVAVVAMLVPMGLLWRWQPYFAAASGLLCYGGGLAVMGITPQALLAMCRRDRAQGAV